MVDYSCWYQPGFLSILSICRKNDKLNDLNAITKITCLLKPNPEHARQFLIFTTRKMTLSIQGYWWLTDRFFETTLLLVEASDKVIKW